MQRKLLPYLFLISLLNFTCNFKNAQNEEIKINSQPIDTIKDLAQFKFLVDDYLKIMKQRDSSISNMVILVKISNSISSYNLEGEEPYYTFQTKFDQEYLRKVIRILNCEATIGMGIACPDYNLNIGSLRFLSGSYIVINELNK